MIAYPATWCETVASDRIHQSKTLKIHGAASQPQQCVLKMLPMNSASQNGAPRVLRRRAR